MAQRFRASWFQARLSEEEVPSGVFGNKTKAQNDPKCVDIKEFGRLLVECYNKFDEAGYDVVNVVPISMGGHEDVSQFGKDGTASYSITRGAVVVGRWRD